jgi:hypothetical protein
MANPVVEALTPFIWGAGGSKKTPEEIAREKEVAAELLMRAGNTSAVGHWTQGMARVVDALGGVVKSRRAEAAGEENSAYNSDIIKGLLGGASPVVAAETSAIPMTEAAGELAATAPTQPIDLSGNDVYSGFINTVKQGGVNNPFALAAIAATGKAESGFDSGNVTRTWSDPSESGQAGTAGGIMSWRGPRYQALASSGDLSPAGQAKFFLQENPQLIEALNSAGSLEEAQSLMNNAWKFAGYNRPGGEAARRLALAQSFLPTFQGQGEVAAVTPEAAIEAVSPTGGSLTDEVAEFEQTPAYASQFPGMSAQTGQTQEAAQTSSVAQALAGGQQTQQASGINPAILQALTDPRATPQTRAVAQALMQQQMQQNDPLRRLQIQQAEIELERARNPQQKTPDSVTALQMRAAEAGLRPGTPEYQKFMLSGGDKGITINNEGNIPAGYQAVRDAQGRITSIEPIPGSPAALEMEQALKSRETQGGRRETATDVITTAASEARNLIKNGTLATGSLGRLASNLTESDAAELRRQIDVLKSNATIENLTAMRQASPTGGALGSVTEKEGAMLAAASGAIDPDAGKEQVEKALDNYERTLLRVIHGPKVGDAIFDQSRQDPNEIQTDIPGVKIRRKAE